MSSSSPIEYLDDSDQSQCSRCKELKAVLVTRNEKFCKNCFIRFIRGKQRKQMQDEKYKVKYAKGDIPAPAPTKILLPLSMGISSLVLLDTIISLVHEQMDMHKGRTGVELVVLNIDEHELSSLNKNIKQVIPALRAYFTPTIAFTFKVLSVNSYILDADLIKKINLYPDFSATMESINAGTETTLKDLILACPNKSSTEDLLTIVYDELVVRTAYLESCNTIVYGHNMTRIANEIIALTVKGRGSSIHEKVSDHTVKYQGQDFQVLYPLKEVLRAEIEAYANLMELDQFELVSTKPKSKINRNMTIRELTTHYFNQLDATGYASTASTVVKTGEKLGPPKNFQNADGKQLAACQICGIEIHQNPQAWLQRITVNESAPLVTDEDREYFKLYKEAFDTPESQEGKIAGHTEATPLNICYGCIVTLSSIKATDGFSWPIRNPAQEKEDILNEYILTDDEEEEV